MTEHNILINRAPLLTLCATTVASHFDELTPGSYQARWKNDSHKQLRVLVLQAGKFKEITFDAN